MISRAMIENGYTKGFITLVKDSNAKYGTAAKIGDDIFYFDAERAEQYDPEEYIKNVSKEEVIKAMKIAFDEFHSEMPKQYEKWEMILNSAHYSEDCTTSYRQDHKVWSPNGGAPIAYMQSC